MTNKRLKIIMLLPLLWLVITGGLLLAKETVVRTGNEVILRTAPVDPRDLFRGDYVILRYDISTLQFNDVETDGTAFTFGDTAYVSLENSGRYAEPTLISRVPPTNGLFIKGKVTDASEYDISLEYGIESYFVPEGEGLEIERAREKVDVKAVLGKDGTAILQSLIVDGKEIDY